MSGPQIRVMIDEEDFRHLVSGGELRVVTDEGTACVCFEDIGVKRLDAIVCHAMFYGGNRLGQVKERGPRS